MDVVHSLTLPIHTLYSQVQVPIPHRDNQPLDPGGGPVPCGGGDRQTAPAPEPGPGKPGLVPEPEATPNQDTDIEHMPPNPNAMNPLPTAHEHTPTVELHPRKADSASASLPAQMLFS
ncbi:hypothetical protein CRENBAI_006197 [Crenichthys baileyi]|uniref:Uncharacterized protein n=1 Tax=Crenichthys baileyi TaxID=28760 RepID=A0AAV9RYW6_9TELE